MFGWGKRKRSTDPCAAPSASGQGGPIIAALLIEGETFDLESLQQILNTSKVSGQAPKDVRTEKGVLTFRLGDEMFAVAPMPAPYPWSDLEGPCQTSWMWPKQTPATSVRHHRTHVLLVGTGSSAAAIPRRLALTQVVALAAQQPGVLGIHWPEGTLVHYPPVFIEMAREFNRADAQPLLYLWVDFRLFRNDDGTFGVFTTGLRPLGQMEFEIPRMNMPPGELRDWAVNIAYYLLENGAKVRDGDTIGMSASQQLRLRHAKSSHGAEGTVIRIEG
jgi:hypothetical protein